MTRDEILRTLEKHGTAQNIKVYRRHGAGQNVFGVSFANLKTLHKKLGIDHRLAGALWKTGNSDARTLALMVADPEQLTFKEAEAWLSDIQYYVLSNYLGALVAQTRFSERAFLKWSKSKKEITKHCAYDVLATLLKNGHAFEKVGLSVELARIEKEIHRAPNRARNAMNMALIAIGVYVDGMKTTAIAAAKRIGVVEVDHGETYCKTPDAAGYIVKGYAHRTRKRARKRARKSA